MGEIGGEGEDGTGFGGNGDLLAIEESFSALKAIVQIADDADIPCRNAFLDFLKAICQQNIIDVAFVEMSFAIAQDRAGFGVGKFYAVGLK